MKLQVIAPSITASFLVAAALLMGTAHSVAPALADATTTITFDDLPVGTHVSNQYNAEGVNFEQGDYGLDVACYPVVEQLSAGQAESGDQVADTTCVNGDTGGSRAYGVNTANSLAVGHFGDDKCADLFQATGASWWYSPCGSGVWH